VRTTLLALLGLVIGVVVGAIAFDRGPGIEPLALLAAAGGLAAGCVAGIAAGRRRRRDGIS
jgi:NaMN:DMB phosphoribosyltransferase